MQVLRVTALLLLLMGGLQSRADVPRSLALGLSTMPSRSFGGLCYSMEVGGGLPCNAAFITEAVKKPFYLGLFGSNNVSYINDVKALLDHNADQGTVERLFSQTKDGQMEVSTEAAYRGNGWGVAFTPFQMKYYSFLRNRALPQLTLLASREENLRVQFGGYLENEGSWGVEIRGVNRKFISQSASLTDTLAEGSKELLNPQTQRAVYIEPGLTRVWTEYEWTPRLSMTLTQIGFVDKKHQDFRNSPELHVGGSITPPVSLGAWMLGLDLQLHNEIRKWSDPIRLGSSYEVGRTKVTGSFGASDYAVGLQMRYGSGIAGLMYQSQWIENWVGEDEWVRTLAVQIGVEF